jgi:hypothetical protein
VCLDDLLQQQQQQQSSAASASEDRPHSTDDYAAFSAEQWQVRPTFSSKHVHWLHMVLVCVVHAVAFVAEHHVCGCKQDTSWMLTVHAAAAAASARQTTAAPGFSSVAHAGSCSCSTSCCIKPVMELPQ